LVIQFDAWRYSVMLGDTMWCLAIQCDAWWYLQCDVWWYIVILNNAVWCLVLQCDAWRYSVMPGNTYSVMFGDTEWFLIIQCDAWRQSVMLGGLLMPKDGVLSIAAWRFEATPQKAPRRIGKTRATQCGGKTHVPTVLSAEPSFK
jgi:hypothetical protein